MALTSWTAFLDLSMTFNRDRMARVIRARQVRSRSLTPSSDSRTEQTSADSEIHPAVRRGSSV